jgi:hypothetical protein
MIIKAFQTDRGENVFKKWVRSQPVNAQAEIKSRLRYLKTLNAWEVPYVKKLRGTKCLFEIRIKKNNVQYRPLGFYGPDQNEFTLLAGAIEKDSKFQPRTVIQTAETRRKKILKDKRYAIKYFNDI